MKKLLLINFFLLFSFACFAQQGKVIPVAEHYPGGQDSLVAFIENNIIYPPVAKRNRMQGECVIGFVLEEDGRVSNVKVIKNVGGGCGEEAVRVVKLLNFNAPGYKMQTSIPVYFKL